MGADPSFPDLSPGASKNQLEYQGLGQGHLLGSWPRSLCAPVKAHFGLPVPTGTGEDLGGTCAVPRLGRRARGLGIILVPLGPVGSLCIRGLLCVFRTTGVCMASVGQLGGHVPACLERECDVHVRSGSIRVTESCCRVRGVMRGAWGKPCLVHAGPSLAVYWLPRCTLLLGSGPAPSHTHF